MGITWGGTLSQAMKLATFPLSKFTLEASIKLPKHFRLNSQKNKFTLNIIRDMLNRICNYLVSIILEVMVEGASAWFSPMKKKEYPYINCVPKYFRLNRLTSKFTLNIIGDMLNRVCYSFLEVMVEGASAEDVQVDSSQR